MGLYEVLDPHLHEGVVAGWELLTQRVTQVHPQLLPTLVLIAQAKVVFLQNAQSLAHLLRDGETSDSIFIIVVAATGGFEKER